MLEYNHKYKLYRMFLPEKMLNQITKAYDGLWPRVERMFFYNGVKTDNDGVLMKWDPYCFLPTGLWHALMEKYKAANYEVHEVSFVYNAIIGAWRYSKGIYNFDPEIFKELIKTKFQNILPVSVLLRLPEWCVYIKFPEGIKIELDWVGMFVSINHETDRVPQLHLMFVTEDEQYSIAVFYLHENKTIAECLNDNSYECDIHFDEWDFSHSVPVIETLINLVLYICSGEPDIQPDLPKGYPLTTKTKKGPRLFPAQKVRVFEVGKDIGAKIKLAKESMGSGLGKKTQHLRRAHWHGYWTGKGRTEFKYNWLAPIFIGEDLIENN